MKIVLIELINLPVKLSLIFAWFMLRVFKRETPEWLDRRLLEVTQESILTEPESYRR